MEILKLGSKLSDKMDLKGVISKKSAIFLKNLLFFVNTYFRCILSLGCDPIFGISIKLRIF